MDDVYETQESMTVPNIEDPPIANSTLIEPSIYNETTSSIRSPIINNSLHGSTHRSSIQRNTESGSPEGYKSHDVGDMSHIPRIPPSQVTFSIPTIMDKVTMYDHDEDLYGMIKLRDNDVCYTSGTIEWVGRKRNYPLNSGFKLLPEQNGDSHQSHLKKLRKLNETFTGIDKFKECDCADVLPTVNAIVDHLNALHEAIDLVDLRLNNLEDVMNKYEI